MAETKYHNRKQQHNHKQKLKFNKMVYFVTEVFIKDETPIGENVDIKKVMPFIKTAAYMRLIPVLGETFFNSLLTKYNNQTLTAEEISLVEKIKLVVAWYASSMAIPDINKKRTNKGQQKQKGDYSESATENDEVQAQDRDSVTGRFWINQLKNELKRKGDLFPVYKSRENQESFMFEEPKEIEPDSFNDSIYII